jgi:hypothetical protein
MASEEAVSVTEMEDFKDYRRDTDIDDNDDD